MAQLVGNVSPSSSRFRLVGYGLLLLALFDLIHILVPLRLMNPVWEFQTIGALVERVPIPLLGLMLVFYGEANLRKKWEITFLKFLPWASLLVGVLFMLLIPLVVVDSLRLNNQINPQINTEVVQQISKLQQLENQVNKGTAKELSDLATRLNQGSSPDIENPQKQKSQILSKIAQAKKTIQSEAEATKANRRLALVKNAVQRLLGSLVAGVLFIYMAVDRKSKALSERYYLKGAAGADCRVPTANSSAGQETTPLSRAPGTDRKQPHSLERREPTGDNPTLSSAGDRRETTAPDREQGRAGEPTP